MKPPAADSDVHLIHLATTFNDTGMTSSHYRVAVPTPRTTSPADRHTPSGRYQHLGSPALDGLAAAA